MKTFGFPFSSKSVNFSEFEYSKTPIGSSILLL
jgi:hypothetical protein